MFFTEQWKVKKESAPQGLRGNKEWLLLHRKLFLVGQASRLSSETGWKPVLPEHYRTGLSKTGRVRYVV
jgi:hypothetical protein